MITIIDAILNINPSAQVSIGADDINTLIWENETTPISNEDILTKQAELQADYDALEYSRSREKEYPSMADQLDYIYHNGVTKWKTDMITPVKEKYPKPD